MKKGVIYSLIAFIIGCSSLKHEKVLFRFAKFQERFRFFFLVDDNWIEARYADNTFYSNIDSKLITTIKHYVVTYRNGILVHEPQNYPHYPSEVTWLDQTSVNEVILGKHELESGNRMVEISYQSSPIFKSKHYYQTNLKNISSKKYRVLKFGNFTKVGSNYYQLNNFTGDFFTSNDFQNWYMDNELSWINPGETVSDPINWGGQLNNWAYQIEVENGDTLWISNLK